MDKKYLTPEKIRGIVRDRLLIRLIHLPKGRSIGIYVIVGTVVDKKMIMAQASLESRRPKPEIEAVKDTFKFGLFPKNKEGQIEKLKLFLSFYSFGELWNLDKEVIAIQSNDQGAQEINPTHLFFLPEYARFQSLLEARWHYDRPMSGEKQALLSILYRRWDGFMEKQLRTLNEVLSLA